MCKITIDSSVQPPEGKEPMIELELPYISTIDEVPYHLTMSNSDKGDSTIIKIFGTPE